MTVRCIRQRPDTRLKGVQPASALTAPHGGALIDLFARAEPERRSRRFARTAWTLTPAQLCDLELLAVGAFSPLNGFLGMEDYQSVCSQMRLANGLLWPIPVVLEIPEDLGCALRPGGVLRLCGPDGRLLALQTVEQKWHRDRRAEAHNVFGTTDPYHPGVAVLLHGPAGVCISGPLQMVDAVPTVRLHASAALTQPVACTICRRRARTDSCVSDA